MPTYRVHVINSDFKAEEEKDRSNVQAAAKHALKGALEIGSEQVLNGETFFGAEVRVDDGNETALRSLVTVGSSPLQ